MSKPGRPTRQQSSDLTRRIIEVATRMFLDKGYAGTTIDELSTELGASKRSVYSRFANKTELFQAVTASYAEQALSTLPLEAAPGITCDQRLYNACMDVLGLFLVPDVIAIERVVVQEAGQIPEIVPILENARCTAMRHLYPPIAALSGWAVDDPQTCSAAQMLWDLTVAAQVRGAALGLCKAAITKQTRDEVHRRILLFVNGLPALIADGQGKAERKVQP